MPESSGSCDLRRSFFRRSHATFGMIEHEFRSDADLCRGFIYATMLREPLALINSVRVYVASPASGTGSESWLGNLETLKKMLATGVGENVNNHRGYNLNMSLIYDNFNVRLIADCLSVPAGGINETHLQRAKYVLKTHFNVV